MKPSRILTTAAALAFTLLVGQITDRTTGQPLHGVQIQVQSGHKTVTAVTDTDGRFRLPGVEPGRRTLRYSSNDVPPQKISLTVQGAHQQVRIVACSTTLDYSCADVEGGGS